MEDIDMRKIASDLPLCDIYSLHDWYALKYEIGGLDRKGGDLHEGVVLAQSGE